MQAPAAEFSGCAGKFRCILERRVQKRFVSIANRAQMENSLIARDFCGLASLQHVWLFFARRWVVFRLA